MLIRGFSWLRGWEEEGKERPSRQNRDHLLEILFMDFTMQMGASEPKEGRRPCFLVREAAGGGGILTKESVLDG